jgi:hypothetical protein
MSFGEKQSMPEIDHLTACDEGHSLWTSIKVRFGMLSDALHKEILLYLCARQVRCCPSSR